jgi:tetratricopeptide (TPR) repeat protein
LIPFRRFIEARSTISQAREREPLSLPILATCGLIRYFEREYEAAVEEYRQALELDPNFGIARYFLGQTYLQMERFADGLAELEKAAQLTQSSPECLAALGYGHALNGDTSHALRLASELEARSRDGYVSPVLHAWIDVGLRNFDLVFRRLEEAYRMRAADLIWTGVRPVFDPVRADPRFAELLGRLGLYGETTA